MNNVIQPYKESKNAREFAGKYLDYLSSLLKKLDTKSIATFIEEIEASRHVVGTNKADLTIVRGSYEGHKYEELF